ncbi:MAG: histidinol dehydrogenase [Candidatus Saccharimonadales bacterium]
MKIYKNPAINQWKDICLRPQVNNARLEILVKKIFTQVKSRGDNALKDYTLQFDDLALTDLVINEAVIQQTAAQISDKLRESIDAAYENILSFHRAQQLDMGSEYVETMPGVLCWREARPIENVGLYIPGGSAPLISTVLMLGIPAKLAGCKQIILCTPPTKREIINPALCYASQKVGATCFVSVGGIQAIAAMALGTESVPKVDKIFGPGNQYVTAAKQYAARNVAIDMPAGPSELLVIADKNANPAFVASDLLSQAEHGPDSQVVLVSNSQKLISSVQNQLDKQLASLPRKKIAESALINSFAVELGTIKQCIEFANIYAPEHLILNIKTPESLKDKVINAGSVFLGSYSPESAGDYASGTNHTLPTNGWSRSYGGVSLDSFVKKVTFQSLTQEGLTSLSGVIETLARAEGLEAHARAVSIRKSDSRL